MVLLDRGGGGRVPELGNPRETNSLIPRRPRHPHERRQNWTRFRRIRKDFAIAGDLSRSDRRHRGIDLGDQSIGGLLCFTIKKIRRKSKCLYFRQSRSIECGGYDKQVVF